MQSVQSAVSALPTDLAGLPRRLADTQAQGLERCLASFWCKRPSG